MNITIGNYEIELGGDYPEGFDPLVQDNASKTKKLIDGEDTTVGFIYNCVYKQKRALEYGLESIRDLYPKSKIYIVSDGGMDFSYLEDKFDDLKFEMGEDTVGPHIDTTFNNFTEPSKQAISKKIIATMIERVQKGIEYCENPDWIFMTEPDVLLRGKFSVPENAKLLGTRLNYAWDLPIRLEQYIKLNELLSKIDTSIPMFRWGAVPPIFQTESYLKAVEVYKENFDIMDKITEISAGVNCFDVIIPVLFTLIGEPEVFNSETIECLRDPSWKTSSHPIVHQWRELYDEDHYYKYIDPLG
tara:strand:+ start:1063 stop:1965 length:903 start_codon:yes stop_codon:yes gene_type:complete